MRREWWWFFLLTLKSWKFIARFFNLEYRVIFTSDSFRKEKKPQKNLTGLEQKQETNKIENYYWKHRIVHLRDYERKVSDYIR